MKTYTIKREDGSLHAFEVDNTWLSMGAIKRVLYSVPEITSLKRHFLSEDCLEFIYNDEPWIVWEACRHCSRYWIGPKNVENHKLDVTDINDAFVNYEPTLKRFMDYIHH